MLKEIIKRGCQGFGIGIFFLNVILLLKSAVFGHGEYFPAADGLIQLCSTELAAVFLQFLLTGFMGAIFGASTLIFESEKISIFKATMLHFLLVMPLGTVIAWICNWMPHTTFSLCIWILQFLIYYIAIWFICYLIYRKKVKQINEKLAEEFENKN